MPEESSQNNSGDTLLGSQGDQGQGDQGQGDQGQGDQGQGDQGQGDQGQQQGAPEKYEFKAPEGQAFDPEFLTAYSEVAKELNLTQDNAQKLIDKISPVIQQRQMAQIEAVRNDWAEQSKSDAEFGGANLQENLGIAKQALDKFASPALKELVVSSGLGNHPEFIRTWLAVGKAMSPDSKFVGGHKEGKETPKDFSSYADALYPSK